MTSSIYRKPETPPPPPDPMSATSWGWALRAAEAIAVALNERVAGSSEADVALATRDLAQVTAATPAALDPTMRTKVPAEWTYMDFVKLLELRGFFSERLTSGDLDGASDVSVRLAALATRGLDMALAQYGRLAKRERAMERLSGEESGRKR